MVVKSSGIYLQDGWDVTVARNPGDIEALRPVWEQMQAKEPYPVLNADIDRFLSVIEASGGSVQPYIILVKENGRPAAMMLARIGKSPVELKLGYKTLLSPKLRCLTMVYGGILGQPEEELCSFLMGKLMEMLRQGEVDMVYFNHLRTDSCVYQLSRKSPGVLSRGRFPKVENHRSMSVPENLDQFYQARSKKHRGNLKRYIKKLEKEYPNQAKVITYTQEDDLDDAMRAASEISHSTYQHGLGCGFADNPRTHVLLTTAARRSWLRMSVLSINGEPAAFQVGLHYGKKYILEQIGFDPKWGRLEVGTVLFLRVLEDICADPDIEFVDFSFGDADYKRSYGDKRWQEASGYIFAPRLYPITVNAARTFFTGVNSALKYILNKAAVAGWVKRFWRDTLCAKGSEKRLKQGGDT